MSELTSESKIQLSSGTSIPQLGFGVYLSPPEVTTRTVTLALEAGYRHIDSAQWYFNESEVGQAVSDYASKVPREKVFLTTKLGHADKISERLQESIKKIDPSPDSKSDSDLMRGYVDLFLIHAPSAGPEKRKEQWREMEKLVESGQAKAIGVSNYGVKHLKEMESYAKIPPAVNQIELHPWCQQPAIVEYCQANNIALEAYSPMAQGKKSTDPTLVQIAKEVDRSWAQVLIRWSLQRGFIPLPKSDTEERIISNFDVFGFELSKEQMDSLNALDVDEHVCINVTECD